MNTESIIKQYDFNLKYAIVLVQDLTEEHMTMVSFKRLENNFVTLGQLISGSAALAEDLDAKFEMPDTLTLSSFI